MNDPARQLLRALRGPMSQVAFSRLLGYSTNTAADWEAGRRFPTIEETLRAASRRRIDVPAAFEAFHPHVVEALDIEDLSGWLSALRGSLTNREIAARSGFSEHAVGRWLRGESRARLPQFLSLIETLTHRCSDWVAALVPIDAVPSMSTSHHARNRIRGLVYEQPWVAAILTQLGVLQRERPHPSPAEPIARSLGLPTAEVEASLALLVEAGIIERGPQGLRTVRSLTVSSSASERDRQRIRHHWASVSLSRVDAPDPEDWFGHNVFNVSREDLGRIRELLQHTLQEIRTIVGGSPTSEITAVLVSHLFALPIEEGDAP